MTPSRTSPARSASPPASWRPKTPNRFDLIRFLDHLDAEIPVLDGQQIVAITDNLSTRGTQEVQDWLHAHPRWSFAFTPTHASWLNQIEIFVRHEAPCERRERTNNSQPCRLRCRPRADAAARRSWGHPWARNRALAVGAAPTT
jgi:hypothetical protein